jgi:ELWxxDGT repeat protein
MQFPKSSNAGRMTQRKSGRFTSSRTPGYGRKLHVEVLESRRLLSLTPQRIEVGIGDPSNPRDIVEVGSTAFFTANDGAHGAELWKSDGTQAGTALVKDIRPGAAGSIRANSASLVNETGLLFFEANDGTAGYELWRSDGTTAGTVMLKDINAGTASSYPASYPFIRADVNGLLFFRAFDATNGFELWKSDGTPAGTMLVKDIQPGSSSSSPSDLINVGGALYFWANDGTHGRELWTSDGTDAGTVLVKDILPGLSSSSPGFPNPLTEVNGTIYFSANDGTNGAELWRSDGTDLGTFMVKDIRSGSATSNPFQLTNVNGTLFLRANDGTNGNELWRSDGTDTGTVLVKDIRTGVAPSNAFRFTNVNGTLYFLADDGTHGYELWKSDGSPAGTVLVKDIAAGSGTPFDLAFVNLTNVNGTLFFSANDGTNGLELWKSDGSEAGTVLAKDIRPGDSSQPRYLANVNGTLFFRANDGAHGNELWKSDGTQVGTVLVKDVNHRPSGAPAFFTDVNGVAFFTAFDAEHGRELWKSDGTQAGTALVKDIIPGPSNFFDYSYAFLNVNGTLFFKSNDGTHGTELWKSDGTQAGTVMVKDIFPGAGSGLGFLNANMENVNGTLFFMAYDGIGPSKLWKSDGTEAGTVLVKDFGLASDSLVGFRNLNGTLLFVINDGIHGYELWRSDGTQSGTVLVKDIFPGASSSLPLFAGLGFQVVNGTLLFRAIDGIHGQELWKSDGTTAGTVLVKDINVANSSSLPFLTFNLADVNGTAFFEANDGTQGYALWKSDGTDAGTVMVKHIDPLPGLDSAYPSYLTNVGGILFFSASTPAGIDLWKSDGTDAGTVLVKDFSLSDSNPRRLTNVNGTLFFSARDTTHGEELWMSDGTDAGTVLVQDTLGGSAGSYPRYLKNVNGTLFFSAIDDLDGILERELWVVPASTIAGRHIFYNQSKWDGNGASINGPADNLAIATDKTAYLPGAGIAGTTNVTSYTKGINGIMVDITGTLVGITTADFVFKVGNDNSPDLWAAAPAPSGFSVIAGGGVGGSDRVEITWANSAIKAKWLEVQVLAGAHTGLAVTDVHFWGNRPSDAFNTVLAGSFDTNVLDAGGVFGNLNGAATITNIRDFDRDGDVDVGDAATVFASLGNTTRINIGGGGPFAPAGIGSDAGDGTPAAIASALAAGPVISASTAQAPSRRIESLGVASTRLLPVRLADETANEIVRPTTVIERGDSPIVDLALDDELLDSLLDQFPGGTT